MLWSLQRWRKSSELPDIRGRICLRPTKTAIVADRMSDMFFWVEGLANFHKLSVLHLLDYNRVFKIIFVKPTVWFHCVYFHFLSKRSSHEFQVLNGWFLNDLFDEQDYFADSLKNVRSYVDFCIIMLSAEMFQCCYFLSIYHEKKWIY